MDRIVEDDLVSTDSTKNSLLEVNLQLFASKTSDDEKLKSSFDRGYFTKKDFRKAKNILMNNLAVELIRRSGYS